MQELISVISTMMICVSALTCMAFYFWKGSEIEAQRKRFDRKCREKDEIEWRLHPGHLAMASENRKLREKKQELINTRDSLICQSEEPVIFRLSEAYRKLNK